MKKVSSTKVVIDRIEGEHAVVVDFDDDSVKFNLPVDYLPKGVKEGDHLQMSFKVEEESREAQKKRVQDLLKELTEKKEGQ